ncbi:MAG: hypothetical protein AB1696_03185 [Planctomycetota bacterium]
MSDRQRYSGRGKAPWRQSGVWLAGDTHAHYRNVGVERLAAEASPFCDFIAITSHSHRVDFWKAQHAHVAAARKTFPNLLIFHGIEWACPVGGHATVLVEPSRSENTLLSELWRRHDRWYAPSRPDRIEDAVAALRFLEGQSHRAASVVILNHPSYGRPYTADDMRRLYDAGDMCVALEGARGNQSQTSGSEIDPVVRRAGGVYDALLSEGRRVGLVAASDFHSHVTDGGKTYWPGEFARTHVFCPERSYRGVMAGLRSAATYFVHGDIIGPLRFTVGWEEREAMLGEILRAPRGAEVRIALDCIERTPIERVEFISNNGSPCEFRAARRTRRMRIGPWSRFELRLPRAQHDFFVRARGVSRGQRKPYRDESGDMWFYTSAIHVHVS